VGTANSKVGGANNKKSGADAPNPFLPTHLKKHADAHE